MGFCIGGFGEIWVFEIESAYRNELLDDIMNLLKMIKNSKSLLLDKFNIVDI
jgi:hypothetical protein